MGMYLFENPDTGEVREIFQHMKEEHIFIDEQNKQWNRIFCIPQAAISTKFDPFSNQDFVEKTRNKKGNIGNLLDLSKELSLEREKITGKDVVREAALADWSKRRKGKKYVDPKEFKTKEI